MSLSSYFRLYKLNKIIHQCKYCSSSLQEISHKLDDIYQVIYSSQDRSATKAEQIRSVKAMYDCAQRHKDWRRSDYKAKIERLYNASSLIEPWL